MLFPLVLISFIVSAYSKKKQSLHDRVANTYVAVLNAPNHGTNPTMTLEEFFEEMTSRGLRMYSEQLALAEEIYGSRIIEPDNANTTSSAIGVLALVISIILNIKFYFFPTQILKTNVQHSIPQ